MLVKIMEAILRRVIALEIVYRRASLQALGNVMKSGLKNWPQVQLLLGVDPKMFQRISQLRV